MSTLRIAVLTISDTRTLDTDTSGALLAERLQAAGHTLTERKVVPDDLDTIVAELRRCIDDPEVQSVLCTGGTGITDRDVTPEALAQVVTKPIPGFGELFRWLSYRDIGTSTIQSRADAGVCGDTLVFVIPGSTGACKTAWDEILASQLDVTHKPCNFVELLPRVGKGKSEA